MEATPSAAAGFAVKNAVGIFSGRCTRTDRLNISGARRCHNGRCRGCPVEGHEDPPSVGLLVHFPAKKSAQDFLESSTKFPREHRVDERVDGRVAVAEPEEDGEDED